MTTSITLDSCVAKIQEIKAHLTTRGMPDKWSWHDDDGVDIWEGYGKMFLRLERVILLCVDTIEGNTKLSVYRSVAKGAWEKIVSSESAEEIANAAYNHMVMYGTF